MPNCEVRHTWRPAGGREAGAACAMAADDGDAVAVAAAKMDGRFIFNRLIQTGSIEGKPDRIVKINPEPGQPPRIGVSIDREIWWVQFPLWSGDKGPPRRAHDDFPRGRVPRLRPRPPAPRPRRARRPVPPPLIAVGPRNEPFAINMPSCSAAS